MADTMEGGLTDKEILLVRGVWAKVALDLEASGVVILKTFLDKHDYYSKFERFRDFPRDRITENPVFRNHSLKLMRTLDDAITNLDQPDSLRSILLALGQSHARRKIQLIHFEHLRVVILDILTNAFSITEEELDAWNRTLQIATSLIGEGLGSA